MPALSYPSAATLTSWGIEWDKGNKDYSTMTSEIGVDSNRATRKALVSWDYRFDFIEYVLGKSAVWNDSGTLRLSRLLPRTFPGKDWLIATKAVSVKPHGTPSWTAGAANYTWNGTSGYPKAEIEFLYEQAPYLIQEDADVTTELERYVENPAGDPEPNLEVLQLPGAVMRYASPANTTLSNSTLNNTTIPFGLNIKTPNEKFNVTWHRLPFSSIWDTSSPLYLRIFGDEENGELPYMGCINSEVFFGRPVGTVLFNRPIPKKRMGVDGEYELDLTYEFIFRPVGHNWIYGYRIANGTAGNTTNGWYAASTTGNYSNAASIGDYNSLHLARDLNLLFSVD